MRGSTDGDNQPSRGPTRKGDLRSCFHHFDIEIIPEPSKHAPFLGPVYARDDPREPGSKDLLKSLCQAGMELYQDF